jgi:hypothetical protein
MSQVRRIVEAHNGRIEVTSNAAEGSTFRVHLPLADGAPVPAARDAHAPRPSADDGRGRASDGHARAPAPAREAPGSRTTQARARH